MLHCMQRPEESAMSVFIVVLKIVVHVLELFLVVCMCANASICVTVYVKSSVIIVKNRFVYVLIFTRKLPRI